MRRRSDRKIVLIDFGAVKDISALGTDTQGNTNVTVSIGSPGYMPSEQARGKPRLSSDVYAVGMIGIQALTGIAPDSLQEDATTGEILWRDRAQVSPAFADILQNMVFYHFSQRYKSAIEAFHALQSLATTNVNLGNISNNIPTGNSASTEAISYPSLGAGVSGGGAGIAPTVITNSQNNIPTTPNTVNTTPQTPATISHPTISAPTSAPNLRPILWIALIAFTSVTAAIATAMILPNFLNGRQDKNASNNANTAKPEAANTATPTQTSIATSPTLQDTPNPEPSKEIATLTPTPVPSPTPTNTPTAIPSTPPISDKASFGAIARSPSTQSKGYSWNYPTRKAAENRALSECENSGNVGDCQVLIWANNACMSISEGSNGAAGSGWSTDMVDAENRANQVCRQYQGIDCEVTRTICLPYRQ